LTLYPHKEREFWLWMTTWAVFLTKPSDLGYSDVGYDLPELEVVYHKVNPEDQTIDDLMDWDVSVVLEASAKEKRKTLDIRVAKAKEIVEGQRDKHFILWHDLEDERHALCKAIKGTKAAYGSMDLEEREQLIVDFAEGKYQYLATKPRISGSGCNFQHYCHNMIFVGIGYKFNDFIQSLHRVQRYGQKEKVVAHVIYSESESYILNVILEKWENHRKLVANMTDIIKQFGLAKEAISTELSRSMGLARQETQGKRFVAVNNDCILETARMPENSVDLIHTSITFGNHYEYSPSYNDLGHNTGNETFFEQMDFLTPELLRILRPGRVAAVHVKDRILFGSVTGHGMPSVDPFHALTIAHYMKHRFIFFGMVTIETDVVRENNQTYRLGWTEQCKDGSKMGVGCPEYLLLFRKLPSDTSTAYADLPVTKSKEVYTRGRWQIDARGKWNSSGNRFLTSEEIAVADLKFISRKFKTWMESSVYNYEVHANLANELDKLGKLPSTFEALQVPARDQERVWSDVSRMRVLNSEQSRKKLQKHVCPLQFDIVDRVINRYSNPGEVVFDPFGGIMTVPYRAATLGRVGYGCELNPSYWADGVEYLKTADNDADVPTLAMFEEGIFGDSDSDSEGDAGD
jgi:DNA modification methylase